MNTEQQLALAESYVEIGYLDRARQQCHEILGREPDNVSCLYALARLESIAGNVGLAEGLGRRIVTLAPQLTSGWILLAYVARDAGHPRDALDAARRAVALDPDHPGALLALAEQLANGQARKAAAIVDRVAQLDPENPNLLRVRAVVQRRQHLFGQARRTIRQLVAQDPTDAENVYFLAIAEGRGLRFGRAVRGIFAAAAQHPQSGAKARSYLGFVWVQLVFLVQVLLLVALLTMTFSSETVVTPTPGVTVGSDGTTTTVLPPLTSSKKRSGKSSVTIPSMPPLPDFHVPTFPSPMPPPPTWPVPGPGAGIAPAKFEQADVDDAEFDDGPSVQVRATSDFRLRAWGRGAAGVVLLIAVAFCVVAARAVPKGGWPVVRSSIGATSAWFRLVVTVAGFVAVALAAIAGWEAAALAGLIPVLIGGLSAGYHLVRNR